MAYKGQTGTSMGGVQVSPARRKRQARARRNQEQRWAEMAGPVTVTRITDKDSGESRAIVRAS
jgi:hypothetical protein